MAILSSCKQESQVQALLNQVDSYIEHYPDSALSALQSIPASQLITKKEQAKHALLLSMALDKNYIDTTDFSVLQPAIDYYSSHGTKTDKLRMYYYKGRIYRNMNNDEAAMKAFVKGLDEGNGSEDNLTMARLLLQKAAIHDNLFEFGKYAELSLKAAELFYKGGRKDSWFYSHINAFYGYYSLSDSANALKQLEYIKQIVDTTNISQLNKYYESVLTYHLSYSKDKITPTIVEYLSNIPAQYIPWLSIAAGYLYTQNYDDGLRALQKYKIVNKGNYNHRYNAIASRLYENLNYSDSALLFYKKYFMYNDSLNMSKLKQETQFIEERHTLELDKQKEKNSKKTLAFVLVIVTISLSSIILYARNKFLIAQKEKALIQEQTDKLHILYNQLEEEKEKLRDALEHNNKLDEQIRKSITSRIDLLNQILAMEITGNYKHNNEVYKKINDTINNKDSFINTTILAFEASHPKFISFLKEKNLTDVEIGYCCLYAIGLKGKEIGSYTQSGRSYNVSSNIRTKFGLTANDTNLSIYIKDLLKNSLD